MQLPTFRYVEIENFAALRNKFCEGQYETFLFVYSRIKYKKSVSLRYEPGKRNKKRLCKVFIKNYLVCDSMYDDEFLLNEFQKAFQRRPGESFIDFDKRFTYKFDLQVHRFEDVMRGTNRTVPPNRWAYHRIALIKKGSGEFTTAVYKFKAVKNTLIVMPARLITSSKNWSMDMEGYVMVFNMDFFVRNNFPYKNLENKNILQLSFRPYIHITDEQTRNIANIFETILEERKSKEKHTEELVALKITELVILCERLFDDELHFECNKPSIDIPRKFIDLLEANFLRERSVGFYAEKLSVHPNHLNALIKKHIGLTAKESIQNRVYLETKYLLHSTNLSIKEISSQLGFKDANYLTSFFTRFENMSPGTYRSSFL